MGARAVEGMMGDLVPQILRKRCYTGWDASNQQGI